MIKCKNKYCKFHDEKDKCSLKKAYIGIDARCENFEKGFLYYFYYLGYKARTNFVTDMDLNDTMRYSIYYLMKCLPIVYSYDSCRGIIVFRDKDNPSKILNVNDIYDMIGTDRFNNDALHECINDFMKNGLPKPESDDTEEKEVINHDYGWVSPTGEFTESPWGTHEESAEKIINSKNWGEEYNTWLDEQPNNAMGINFRDFLIRVKRYVLIHDPSGVGYRVTNSRELTKKQKDFLYGYFLDMGMTLRAEEYMNE